jgi:hypothetical protein
MTTHEVDYISAITIPSLFYVDPSLLVGRNQKKAQTFYLSDRNGTSYTIKCGDNHSLLSYFEQEQWEYLADCIEQIDTDLPLTNDELGSETNPWRCDLTRSMLPKYQI